MTCDSEVWTVAGEQVRAELVHDVQGRPAVLLVVTDVDELDRDLILELGDAGQLLVALTDALLDGRGGA